MKNEHDIDFSVDTLITRDNEDRIKGNIPYEKRLFNQVKANRWLAFAKRMKKILDKDPYLLHCIVFTDETKMHFFENIFRRNVHARFRLDERLHPKNVIGSVNCSGGFITFWGSINYKRIHQLIKFY